MGWQRLAQFVWDLVTFVASFLTLWLEVFLRKDFGERYLSNGIAVVSVLLFFFNFIGLVILRRIFFRADAAFYLVIAFWVVFVILVIIHRGEIRRRNRYGEKWHSWYRGSSHLHRLLGAMNESFPDRLVKLVFEPLAGLVVAFVFWFLSRELTFALGVASVALFIKEANIQASMRQQYLDIVDAQIEAEAISELAEHGWGAVDADPNDMYVHRGYTAFMPANEGDIPDFLEAVAATNPLVAERLKNRVQPNPEPEE